MCSYVVKMRGHVSLKSPAGWKTLRERIVNSSSHPAENLIKNSLIEGFFVFEVVIEQCLVYAGEPRNSVGARPGHAFAGEFTHGSLEDGGATFLRFAAGTKSNAVDCRHN